LQLKGLFAEKAERQKWIYAAVPIQTNRIWGKMLLNTLLGKMPLKISVALKYPIVSPFSYLHILVLLEMRDKMVGTERKVKRERFF